ncbi:hypothetical protein EIP86_003584 [Pleurotus ostreatoroseus]|nr:hypothetical protein EIP86_003584 [Pleurotus ostreatoroseus]
MSALWFFSAPSVLWYAGRVKKAIEYLGYRDCSPGGGLRLPVNKSEGEQRAIQIPPL